MHTYVALFRGINVGGRNRLPMKDLVAILEAMGFDDVRTYIQSGNVVLQSARKCSAKTARDISANVLEAHGFRPELLLLEASDLKQAIAANPFDAKDGKSLHFFFLDSAPVAPDLEALSRVKAKSERFRLEGAVLYLLAPDGIGRSKLAARVERSLGTCATGRNWNTVRKLLEMVEA